MDPLGGICPEEVFYISDFYPLTAIVRSSPTPESALFSFINEISSVAPLSKS